jgi:serine O-acetyltransferase
MVLKAEKYRQSIDASDIYDYGESISEIVEKLVEIRTRGSILEYDGPELVPSREVIIRIIHQFRRILFPEYLIPAKFNKFNLPQYLAQEAESLFEDLSGQIAICLTYDRVRNGRSCSACEEEGREEAIKFIKDLPNLKMLLTKDVQAAYEGDPAASGTDEIILCYPGFLAVTVYRIAHHLFLQKVSLMPRIISEYVHSLTGIDIHPGANIGESFFIDHGVGVVIGATTDIGNRVRIYQGVTLGALALPKEAVDQLRSKKRHPTIADDVIIYAGATILGGETLVGARSVIGGNVWLTESVPPDTKVFIKKPELILK